MATYRERREAKAEKLREWAASRERKADASLNRAHQIMDNIPLGQPILVGHHSEKHARRDQERIVTALAHHHEHTEKATDMASRAAGISDQLADSIYSDDPDAIENLQERITTLEDERAHMKSVNAAIKAYEKRTGKKNSEMTAADLMECGCTAKDVRAFWPEIYGFRYPPYALQNLGGNIKRNRDRLEQVKRRVEITAKAEQSEHGVLIIGADFVNIVFAEKPERAILDALKAAGFAYSGGRWGGYRDRIPSDVLALAS